MDTQITVEHAEELLKLLRRNDLEAAGRFALQHPLLAAAATGRASDQQPRAAGEWMRHLALRAVQDIAPDAEADSKPARARKLLELFYFDRLPRRRVMDKLGYSLNAEGGYGRLRAYAIERFAQSLERLCQLLARMPDIPPDWHPRAQGNTTVGRRLPPHTFHALIGRTDELGRLESWATSPDAPRILCICGLGGVGKTALAAEIAHRALDPSSPPVFDDVLWVSAKRWMMWGERMHRISGELARPRSFSGIVEALLDRLGMTQQSGASAEEKRTALADALSSRRYLIVLDNSDELEDESAVVAGLAQLLGSSKLIITTRRRLDDPSSPVEYVALTGLSRADSNAYLQLQTEAKAGAALIPDDALTDVYAATRGLPLALKLIAGQWKHNDPQDVMRGLRAEATAHKDLLRYLFEQSWSQLMESERLVWIWLGRTITAPITWEQLACVPALCDHIEAALPSLTSRGIVEATEPDDAAAAQFSLHPLAKAFVEGLSRLIYVSEQLHAFHQRECLALAARGWLAYADCIQAEKAIQFDSVRENVVGVAKGCAIAGLHDEVIALWDRLSEALFSRGYWRDYIALDDRCLEAARALKRQDVEVTVLCELGWVLCDATDYARAHECLARALRLARERNDVVSIVRAERYLATLDLRRRNYEAARAGFERLLDMIPRLCDSADAETCERLLRHKSTLHDSLASALMSLGDLDGAEAQLDIRRRIPHAINATAGARFLISQAPLRTKQGRLDEAEFLLVECMQRCRELDARDAFADALMALAKVAMYRNNLSRAAGLAEEALQLCDAPGSLKRKQDAKRFLSSLHTGIPAMDPLED